MTGHTFKIVCLGASPTFGWAVKYEDTYSCQLEKMLNDKYGREKTYEVINAGIIGYSSYQGLLFLKRDILKLKPDLITVAYGLNDVDRHRFFRSNGKSDKELKPKNLLLVSLENLLNRSLFFRLCKNFIFKVESARTDFSGNWGDIYFGKLRVSAQDFRRNINEIIRIANQNRIKVILVKIPINSASFEKKILIQQAQHDIALSKGLDYLKEKRINDAIIQFKDALAYDSSSSKAFFYLAVCYEMKKEPVIAQHYFQEAKKMQAVQLRAGLEVYNGIIEEIARVKGIPLADAGPDFIRNRERKIFATPIHPNNEGHKIVAAVIYDAMLRYNL
jgi:lysophospholipase L1-like esterase